MMLNCFLPMFLKYFLIIAKFQPHVSYRYVSYEKKRVFYIKTSYEIQPEVFLKFS